MSWLERFAVGLVVIVLAVSVLSYVSGYVGEMWRLRGRAWVAWRRRRPRVGDPDFRHALAIWKESRP